MAMLVITRGYFPLWQHTVPLHSLSQLSRRCRLAAAAQGSQHRRERHSVGLDALGVHVLTSIECFGKQEIHALVRKIIYIKPPQKKNYYGLWPFLSIYK